MQATPPPARWWWEAQQWQHWGGAGRKLGLGNPDSLAQLRLQRLQRLHDLQAILERQKLSIPDILIYSPSKFNNLQQVHQVHTAARPTLSWSQRPAPWEITKYENAMKHLETLNNRGNIETDIKIDDQSMWGAARGWAVGALLLLAALILLRATDRCLTRGFFRGRRRRSEEWTTPSVQATRQQDDIISALNTVDCNLSGCSSNSELVDRPPPYSACANKHEEPPPPYSACYMAYPKDGQSVRLYDGQQQIIDDNPTTSEENDRREVAHSHNQFNQEQASPLDNVSVNVENPSVTTVRLAPIASRELSMDSDDTSVDARNTSTSC